MDVSAGAWTQPMLAADLEHALVDVELAGMRVAEQGPDGVVRLSPEVDRRHRARCACGKVYVGATEAAAVGRQAEHAANPASTSWGAP